jgi:hypothetical protein
MIKKALLTLLAVLGGTVFLLGVAFWLRDPLAKFGANRVLAQSQITVTALRGLEFDTHHLAFAELGVTLPSGQALSVTGLDLRFVLQSLRSLPLLQSLDIATAQLSDAAPTEPTAPASATAAEAPTSSLSVNALLAQLRAFPLPSITIDALVIPQWHEAMRLALQPAATGLNLDAASGALHLMAQFSQQDAAAPAQLQASLTRLDAVLGELQVTLAPGPDTHRLDGSGRLVFDDLAALVGELQQASSALPALEVPPLHSADLSWRLSGNVADDLFGTLTNGEATSFVFGLSAGSTFSMPEGVIPNIGASTVTFPGDVTLTVATGAGMGISTGQMPLRLTSHYSQEPLNVDGTFAISDCYMNATPCYVEFRGSGAYGSYGANGTLALAMPSLTAGHGAYHLTTTNLVLSGLPPDIPSFDIDAAAMLESGVLTFTTPLVLHGAPKPAVITASGDYSFATGAVHAQLDSSSLAFTAASPLSSWLREWPYPFDVLTGAVEALEADARWQPGGALTATIKGTLRDIGGAYETYVFSGLNGPIEAEMSFGDPFMLVTPPLSVKLANLDVGVPLTNLTLDFQIDRSTQTFIASAFRAEILGGTLTGENLRYDWSAPSNDITLRFAGLDVAEMVTLVGYEGVEATGRLSGTVPLTLGKGSVVVTGGELHAEEPGGVIRYLSGVGDPNTGNAQLDLVNQILSDFQFHALTSAIDYSPDGELTLSMQLQGHNPDLGSNQPINLNLNLSNNIPALMKSLNAARNIEDFLREQLNTTPQ